MKSHIIYSQGQGMLFLKNNKIITTNIVPWHIVHAMRLKEDTGVLCYRNSKSLSCVGHRLGSFSILF